MTKLYVPPAILIYSLISQKKKKKLSEHSSIHMTWQYKETPQVVITQADEDADYTIPFAHIVSSLPRPYLITRYLYPYDTFMQIGPYGII